MTDDEPQIDPLALGLEWVTKITTVALEMVLPAIGGVYLDRRMGSKYWVLIGAAVGMVAGFWHLLSMTTRANKPSKKMSGERSDNE